MLKDLVKRVLMASPVPLTKNHQYDLLTRKIINSLSKSSNCIDVGCYKGEILDLMKNAAPLGQHFGIEPIPVQFEFLKKKYSQDQNCKIYNIAASNAKGVSDFNYVKSNPSYSGLKKRAYDKPNEVDTNIRVQTDRLDSIIPSNISIELIKIDVEGAELQVLEGSIDIIKRYKPLIIFEHGLGASNFYDTTPSKIYDFFRSVSMNISTLDSFITKKSALNRDEFNSQYFEKLNYYFIAHP